jgi:DNA polymerase I-like protein with 3'-5' exonuclease and polymerase domains
MRRWRPPSSVEHVAKYESVAAASNSKRWARVHLSCEQQSSASTRLSSSNANLQIQQQQQ